MTGLTWLHLSDWHQKGAEFDRQVVLSALLKDIRERTKISPDLEKIDFVVFSGDVAFGGKSEEYQAAKKQFFQPILNVLGLNPSQLFIVPGNHDLDRDKFRLLPGELTKPLAKEADVQYWLTDRDRKSRLLEPFQAFAGFVKKYTGQKQSDFANVRRMKINDKEIALLGLNSAWMCGRNKPKISDKGHAIVGEPQIHGILEEISGADLKFAVLHHPFDWLTEFDCDRIETRLMQSCNFILRGHQHKPKVEIISGTSGDCVVIPAGASYDRRMTENPRYANSYNFVHLDCDIGKGVVFLRRWSDPRTEWIEDVDSCDDGKCDFNLFESSSKAPAEKTSLSIKTIPHQIPPPPRDFKGREEEIRGILSNFEKGATIIGLRGIGGVGKTALALVLAQRLQGRFPDGQLFMDLRGISESPMAPADAMAQVIRAYFGSDARMPENEAELSNLYRSVLAGKQLFLLLDDAANREQVEALLPPEGCSVLITSQKKFSLQGLKSWDLEPLSPSDARQLLLSIAPIIVGYADILSRLCNYLPITLKAAAYLLAEAKDLSPEKYIEEISDERTRLKHLGRGEEGLDVEACFSLSINRLPTETSRVFRLLSVFSNDFDAKAEEIVCQDEDHCRLSELVRWSLVEFQRPVAEEEGRYHLHDLVRLFAAEQLELNDSDDEKNDVQLRYALYYQELLWTAEQLYIHGGDSQLSGLALFDLESKNIQKGQIWAKENMAKSLHVAEICSKFAQPWDILYLRLHPAEHRIWLKSALIAVRQQKNQMVEANHLNSLGIAYADLGETNKAIKYYKQALAIDIEIGNLMGQSNRLSNLGISYSDLGDNLKAIDYYKKALKISRKIGDRGIQGNVLGNLGIAYTDLGNTRKAINHNQNALKILREIGDPRNEAAVLDNLGLAYTDSSKYQKAIEYYEQALKIEREIGDLRGEGNTLFNMSLTQYKLGQRMNAVDCAQKALRIFQKIESSQAEKVRQQLAEWQSSGPQET